MRKRGEEDKARRDKKAREEPLEVGMKVLLKRQVRRKGETLYDPEPYEITKMEGRQVTIKRGSQVKTRETSKIKRYYENGRQESGTDSEEELEWEESRRKGNQETAPQPEEDQEPQPEEVQEPEEPRVEEQMEPRHPEGSDNLCDEFWEGGSQEQSQSLNRSTGRTRRAPQRYGVET